MNWVTWSLRARSANVIIFCLDVDTRGTWVEVWRFAPLVEASASVSLFLLGIRNRQLHPLVHCADTVCPSGLAEVANQVVHALTIHWVQALLAPTDASPVRQADATIFPCTLEPLNRRGFGVAPKGEVTSVSVSLNPLKLRYGHLVLNQHLQSRGKSAPSIRQRKFGGLLRNGQRKRHEHRQKTTEFSSHCSRIDFKLRS
jgi:hypothetical protein